MMAGQHSPGRERDHQELRAWFLQQGGALKKVAVQWMSDLEGYGLVAQTQVVKGETVLEIPLDLCLHVGMIDRSCLKDVITKEPQLYDMEDELLALILMAERRQGVSSFWYPYIKNLPRGYDTPLYWSEEELKHLKGTNVLLLTRLMSSRMEEDWQGLHQVLVDRYPEVLGGLTKDDYVWALSTVWSRAVGIEDSGHDSDSNATTSEAGTGGEAGGEATTTTTTTTTRYMRCLAPVLDMCNHSHQAASSLDDLLSLDDHDDADESATSDSGSGDKIRSSVIGGRRRRRRVLRLRAHASLGMGSQCHMLYGPYGNAKLLFSYGFTVRDNPYLGLDYWVKVPPSARDAQWKAQLLASHELTSNQTYDFKGTLRPGWISPALLATVRLIQLEAEEYHLTEKVLSGEVANARNEQATLSTLASCVKSRLSACTTRAEDDRTSVDKLERLLDDMAGQQSQRQAAADEATMRSLSCLRETTRRRLHALRVCMEDKVVLEHTEAHLRDRLQAMRVEQPPPSQT